MLSTLARCLLALALVAALIDYGGAGDDVRAGVALVVGFALLLTAVGLHARMRVPETAWIAALFLPAAGLCLVQSLPLGWHHPWLTDDLAALGAAGSAFSCWSTTLGATHSCLLWTLTMAGLALAWSALHRGERVQRLADGAVIVAAAHALLGLVLVLIGAEWPTPANADRVRGAFVYTNHAAAFSAGCLPLALATARQLGRWWRWSACGLLALAVLLSGSRGGIIAASVVTLPLAFTLLPLRKRWWWATGVTVAIAGWLALIGVQDVTRRFDALRGPDGPSLSGRVTIWQAVAPVVADAGPLGAGAGAVTSAYRRSGDEAFATVNVNHLHNDALEWWLEFGWSGVLAGLAGMAVTIWLLRRARGEDAPDAIQASYRLGAQCGLLVLLIHCLGDFVWHNEILSMLGVLLLVVIAQTRRDGDHVPVGNSLGLRLVCVATVASIAGAWWPAARYDHAESLARQAGKLVSARLVAHLPFADTVQVQRAAAADTGSARLGVFQAWLLRTTIPPTDETAATVSVRAHQALDDAARLAPGDASAWAERAAWAARDGDLPAMATAIHRALVWAPSWGEIHTVVLAAVGRHGDAALGRNEARTIVEHMLATDNAQPAWFFPLAEQLLGEQSLSQRLESARGTLAASAEPWLAEHGSLAAWLAVRRQLAGDTTTLAMHLWPLRRLLLPEATCLLTLASGADGHRTQAAMLDEAGLPLPDELLAALRADGPPWSLLAPAPDLLDPAQRTTLITALRGDLHRPWVRELDERSHLTARAFAGDTVGLDRESDPRLLAHLATLDTVPGGERQRLSALLARYHSWEWRDLPERSRWSWRYADQPGGHAVITAPCWSAVVIDGATIGWLRGTQDLAPLMGPGLHRVAILVP